MSNRLLIGLVSMYAAACGASSAPSTNTAPTATASAEPAPATSEHPCGYDILASSKGGACLEPAVLGADKTARCERFLQQNGWQRDGLAETAIGEQTGKTIVCYSRAARDGS